MKLIYLPLEPYISRYTWYMSSRGGWAEDWFNRLGVDFVRVEGNAPSDDDNITVGSVLDGYKRPLWAMSQVAEVLKMVRNGEIEKDDWIYTEDFYHPGIDSLFYLRSLLRAEWRVGCFIHAQTIDEWDFTKVMTPWMRPIEVGLSYGYDAVFTCSRQLLGAALIAGYNPNGICLSGLPFNSQRLWCQLREEGFYWVSEKKKKVIFSSRFDPEKNPEFFLDLVDRMKDVEFVLCKPRPVLCADESTRFRAESLPNLQILDTSKDKLAYYGALAEAKVQFNCAYQDWVSWTLLEACDFGCYPVYPRRRDFPYELQGKDCFLYDSLEEAEEKVRQGLDAECLPERQVLEDVVRRHDETWKTQLTRMEFI